MSLHQSRTSEGLGDSRGHPLGQQCSDFRVVESRGSSEAERAGLKQSNSVVVPWPREWALLGLYHAPRPATRVELVAVFDLLVTVTQTRLNAGFHLNPQCLFCPKSTIHWPLTSRHAGTPKLGSPHCGCGAKRHSRSELWSRKDVFLTERWRSQGSFLEQ